MKRIMITAPGNLSEETYNLICGNFRKLFGEDCEFGLIKDDSLLGGFIADVNGEIFDLSVATQLRQLEKHITGDPV